MRYLLTLLALVLLLVSANCGGTVSTEVPSLSPSPPTPVPSTLPSTATTTAVPASPPTTTAVSTPSPPPNSIPTPTPAPPAVTFSADGRHAFPVAGDLALMTWTHYHWDGSHAVDVEADRQLLSDSDAFNTFLRLPVAAAISGTVAVADNPYGGLALLLYGNDGYTYYYGHLSEQWVEDGQIVQVGELLGRIGNTGTNTQYIEPHLHFAIATHDLDDWRWEPDVNAAERFLTWFDLPWQDLNIPDYPVDRVSGWPIAVPSIITRTFSEPLAQNPDHGSIDIMPTTTGAGPIPIFATLGGEVNVNRATVMGLRTQITNRPARTTVVYSFLLETTVRDGNVVQRGDLIGYIDPAVGRNYMLFVKDLPTDPTPTLGDPP